MAPADLRLLPEIWYPKDDERARERPVAARRAARHLEGYPVATEEARTSTWP